MSLNKKIQNAPQATLRRRQAIEERHTAREAQRIANEKARELRPRDFPGGVHPPGNKDQSTGEPIGKIPLAEDLVLPLLQHSGASALPLVKLGDEVLKGQKIAEADGLVSCSVHAPSSGKVIAIEPCAVPHPSGLAEDCIVIRTNGEERWCELEPCEDFTLLSPVALLDKIRDCGIAGMGGAGFPTAVKLDPHGGREIDTLIINGTECEPYITADDMLMREQAEEIIDGITILSYILDMPERVLIGIEDNKPAAIAAMRAAVNGTRFDIVVIPTKYPSGGEKQLIQLLTGREVPNQGLPANVGIVCLNVGTARAVYRAVRFGEPLISRVTTVVGKALERQRNIEVPIGTPIRHILKHHGIHRGLMQKVIIGGPMMGYTIDDECAPVIKTTNCLLVPTSEELPPAPVAQACIRCGFCAEACPASLLPQQLYWYARADDQEKLQAYNLFDCIECGVCSYVCPSSIPLVQYYRAAKGAIRQADTEREKSDRARDRFEFRKLRLEKAEKEKEAKRVARRKVAELAREQQKQNLEAEGAKTDTGEADIVAAALARIKARQEDPKQLLARAERSAASAKSRVERLNSKLEAATQNQRNQLAAQLKAAELKLQEARHKLTLARRRADRDPAREPGDEETNAAVRAITKARAAAETRAGMRSAERLAADIEALRNRIRKAEVRLQKARDQNATNLEAFEAALDKLQKKLEDKMREQQSAQNGEP
ncbi:electron transport complex subunit RsxC [Microbulbifer sp. 2205BS26-8]|uniref:electron transport complex subunit RsxC n=1 Tax=Microbulbifer sp. 2205BS26-8 TaxID=3064386 RepID=UPI00273D3ED4|nr:electron transport complex subunit RsxC [Microbulbifer sp. 2205BS26-8]MDP5209779.1 electron transport complex subunit RsxC [Microbulbifer sp. 2205BS26-8]